MENLQQSEIGKYLSISPTGMRSWRGSTELIGELTGNSFIRPGAGEGVFEKGDRIL